MPGLDWNLLVELARRHRVQGLVWNALAKFEDLPHPAKEALSSDARSVAATNLGIAKESQALLQAFEGAGVPLLFVKGLTVGALAYRYPLLKMGWDIDLLIDPRDLEQASDLISSLGYTLQIPADAAKLSAWHARSKESVWDRDGAFHVELHTRLADNPLLIPTIDVHSPNQWVEVAPDIRLPTLAEEELLAYLAVHGASSAWFRLKWISDFAARLAGKSGEDVESLYRQSQQLGSARAFGQALLLADTLFQVLGPSPRLKGLLSEDWTAKLLCEAALRMMTRIGEPTERLLGTLPIHWTQFLLRPGIGFKYSELRRQAGLLSLRH
nr:nucleotidyltransferase family protein [Sphingomonas caseinilyticus]